jgi:hypothetical protein
LSAEITFIFVFFILMGRNKLECLSHRSDKTYLNSSPGNNMKEC